MRTIRPYDRFVAESYHDKQTRRDFITGLATTFGLVPLTVWGAYRVIRALLDDYRGVPSGMRWATMLGLSKPGRKILDKAYRDDPGYRARLEEVTGGMAAEFQGLEDKEQDVEVTQKMYDAMVMAGVRVGWGALKSSAFWSKAVAGQNEAALAELGKLGAGDESGEARKLEAELWSSFRDAARQGAAAEADTGAEILRAGLADMGHSEKGREIDSNGPISKELARAVVEVLGRYKREMPEVRVTVTAGNDKFHRRMRSRHNRGQAVDMVIDPYNRETAGAFMEILEDYKRENRTFRYIDEYTHPSPAATAGHFHLQVDG